MDGLVKVTKQSPILNKEMLQNSQLIQSTNITAVQDSIKKYFKVTQEIAEHKGKVDSAVIATAQNTKDVNEKLDVVINNQNELIILLKQQLAEINYSIDAIFSNVFDIKDISEESITIAKDMYAKMITGDKFDFKALLIEKGADAFIQALFFLFGMIMPKQF